DGIRDLIVTGVQTCALPILTPRLLPLAPRLSALAARGWVRPLREVIPAVTCTAQATILTGQTPERHGIVANGWLWRDTGEVRFRSEERRVGKEWTRRRGGTA